MEREFKFTDDDFRCICNLVSKHTGIRLSDAKRDMVYGRLTRRLRQLGIGTFAEYTRLLTEDNNADELTSFTNAITTNLTSFFREPHHFEYLKSTLLPALIREKSATRKIRIWSAGCSTGEEPYTIAIILQEAMQQCHGWDIKILATDLDSNVLETAQGGVYKIDRINGILDQRKQRWFFKGRGSSDGVVKVAQELRDLITFRQLNLMNSWPVRGPFDIIFCRNVVIYFDKPTQKTLFERYADLLTPQGHLFVGHSESLFKVTDRFKLIGNTIYQRCK